MQLEKRNNRNGKSSVKVFVFLLSVALVFTGCSVTLPEQKNSHWISEAPDLVIFSVAEDRKWELEHAVLTLDDTQLQVAIDLMNPDWYEVYSLDSEADLQTLFSGDWEYDTAGNLILTVEDDNLMGGKYETITLKPVGTDKEAATDFAGVYPYDQNSRWVGTEPYFSINQKQVSGQWIPDRDTLTWDNKVLDVRTVMTGDRFDVVGRASSSSDYTQVLFSGRWEYDAEGNLVLHIEKDNLMGGAHETMTLKPIGEPIKPANGFGLTE